MSEVWDSREGMKPRIADLYCGVGGAAMGLYRAGFEVVGFDIEPQPRFPFEFYQADALTVDLSGFDAVWASPPCQAYSVTKAFTKRDYPDLIPITRAMLETLDVPWIIENVWTAPLRTVATLCGTMFGLKTFRHRRFESNVMLLAPLHIQHRPEWTTRSHRGYSAFKRGATHISVTGSNYPPDDGMEALGIDWTRERRELSEAIPPAYSECLGIQLLANTEPL